MIQIVVHYLTLTDMEVRMKQTGYWYLRISNILVMMILFIENTSDHFEWAPMMKITIKLMNGPVKSICVLPHREFGHDHGCISALSGAFMIL